MEKTIKEIEEECSKMTSEVTFEELAETQRKTIGNLQELFYYIEKQGRRITEAEKHIIRVRMIKGDSYFQILDDMGI